MNAPLLNPSKTLFRFVTYLLIFSTYVSFMNRYAPGGLGWEEYHSQRIFNAVEYLRLNGYWSAYGYSIWSSCTDCNLLAKQWEGQIYLSGLALIKLWPYILLNHLGRQELLIYLGPLIDRAVIFTTGVLLAETLLKLLNTQETDSRTLHAEGVEDRHKNKTYSQTLLPDSWLGPVVFTLFCSSVWSYLMYRAMWNEIWFLLFFLASLHFLIHRRFKLGSAFIVIAASMHYMLGFTLAFVYVALLVFSKIFKEPSVLEEFVPSVLLTTTNLLWFCLLSAGPTFIQTALRSYYTLSTGLTGEGSGLLTRMGISGGDIHNGGILGALQFLGGGRITICISDISSKGFGGLTLLDKITAFNCTLSIAGMLLLSIIAITGLIWLLRSRPKTKVLLFPIAMVLMVLASSLQQSFSVHLLGHSYLFSSLFACGLLGAAIRVSESLRTRSMSVLVITPLMIATLIMSLRVSMLIGKGLV